MCFGLFLCCFLCAGGCWDTEIGGEEKRTVDSLTGEEWLRDLGKGVSAARSFLRGRRSLSGVRASFIDRFLMVPRFGVVSFLGVGRGGRAGDKIIGEGGASS